MSEAIFWGLLSGSALLIGAVIGTIIDIPRKVLGWIMAFGAGALISAVAYELVFDAASESSSAAVTLDLGLGALTFFVGDVLIDRAGGEHRKRSSGRQAEGKSLAISLGALLDGVPESFVLGTTLALGGSVAAAFVAAVFVSNLPESLSASTGLLRAGWDRRRVLAMWAAITVVAGLSAGFGYAAMLAFPGLSGSLIQSFAGGAILTMLADTMMPEAFEDSGNPTGLFTVLGFALSTVLTLYAD